MENKRTGRKPKPAHLKVHMVAAYLTLEQKELIVKEYGSLTKAIKSEILQPIYIRLGRKDKVIELINLESWTSS